MRLATAVKWTAAAILAVQWYARSGRDFLFGEPEPTYGVGETLRMWVDLPARTRLDELAALRPVLSPQGEVVGVVTKIRVKEGATDYAGHPVEQQEVFIEVERAALGFPINVATSQAADWTRNCLGTG